VHSQPTPFAAILESQPPWWRLGSGGVLVVVAYLGMLLAALGLGGRSAPREPAPARRELVVTLLERPRPIALPAQAQPSAAGDARSLATAPEPVPRAAAVTAKPKLKPKPKPAEPTEVTQPAEPQLKPVPAAAPAQSAASEVSSAVGGSGTAVAAKPTGTGTATGTASAAGTGSARAGNELTVMPFTDGMTRPKLLEMVEPVYTREARDANVKGLFLAKCVITSAGSLQKCRVVKGLPMMDQAVLSALARWRYTPVIYQGKPVAVDYVIQVRLAGP